MVCLALELVGPWVGASFQCRIGGVLMSFYRLMFPGVRSSLVFSGFGLKPPAFGFQSILTVASRLLQTYLGWKRMQQFKTAHFPLCHSRNQKER